MIVLFCYLADQAESEADFEFIGEKSLIITNEWQTDKNKEQLGRLQVAEVFSIKFDFKPSSEILKDWSTIIQITDFQGGESQRVLGIWYMANEKKIRMQFEMNGRGGPNSGRCSISLH